MKWWVGALAVGWLSLPPASAASKVDADGWQHMGSNSAGAEVWLLLESIDRKSPVRAARLRLVTEKKGQSLAIIVRSEYRCRPRQYRLNALISEKEGRVFDRMLFRDGGIWKTWARASDQAAIAEIVCRG